MAFDPYASVKPFLDQGKMPAYIVSDLDRFRVASYEFYENAYWNMPNTFKIVQRGLDGSPIYLPSPRKMIEAVNRYLAVKFNYLIEKDSGNKVGDLVASMFKREKFFTKFNTQKRYGLIRGDAIWHIVGDLEKPEGERLSIYEVSPANYFPIMDPDNEEKRIGCHLVDVITDPADPNKAKQVARVQTYRKVPDTTTITSQMNYFEPAGWDDRNLATKDIKFVRSVVKEFPLPPAITSIPVYGVPNNRIPGPSPFSFSEILGVERVFAAVNQAVSDEELALAMAGLGVFWTTSGPPVDATGKVTTWDIGPARMIEIAKDTELGRLGGVSSVQPMIEHMQFILGETQSSLGIADIAAGQVNVEIAESGIALQLQLSPLLAHNAEKEGGLIESYDQMFFDIVHGWLPAYEGTSADGETSMVAVTGDPMPRNRKADIDELIGLKTGGVLSAEEVREILIAQHGYKIKKTVDALIAEAEARAAAEDPFASRAAAELDGATPGDDSAPEGAQQGDGSED